jgi:hypothetical protein
MGNFASLVGATLVLDAAEKWACLIRYCNNATFHSRRSATGGCSSKAKMSALSKVEMSVSAPFWEFGGCHFDGHGDDEQARAEPS